MASAQTKTLVFSGMRGRDGSSDSTPSPEQGGPPLNKVRRGVNVLFDGVRFAQKRPGSVAAGMTFSSGGPFSGMIRALFRTTDGELLAFDSSGQAAYLPFGAAQWVEMALADAITTPASDNVRFAQMRSGSVLITYPNSANRMHVFSGGAIRRAGMGVPNAPTAADLAGSGGTTARRYRVRMGVLSGSTPLRYGEAGTALTFTPVSGGARVTKPTTVEDATHWRVEVSLDGAVWYLLSGWIAVATTTYDDTVATTTYTTNDAAPLAGQFTNWSAVSVLTTDETRLIGATTAGRIYYSPVRGTTSDDFLDEEFVPDTVVQQNWLDLDGDGAALTALSPPFRGTLVAFRKDSIAQLIPTHVDTAPYRVNWIVRDTFIGALSQECVLNALDEFGQAALYWFSQYGAHRLSASGGLQDLGEDIRDVFVNGGVARNCHAVSWDVEHLVLFWATEEVGTSVQALVFNTKLGRVDRPGYVRNGWSTMTGDFGETTAAVMFANAGYLSASADTFLAPYVAHYSNATPKLLQMPNGTTATDDDGEAFQGTVRLHARHYAGMDRICRVTGASVLGSVGDQELQLSLTPDYGAQSPQIAAVEMTADGSETRRRQVFEDARMNDSASAIEIELGDAEANTSAWTIDELRVQIEVGEEVYP